jgi:hypothetical protein
MRVEFFRRLSKGKLQKVLLLCIAILCAIVGVAQFYVIKNWVALRDAKSRIAKVGDQLRQAKLEAQQAALEESYRQQVKAFVETQQAAIITGDPFAWVVREISLLAEEHPVRVGGLRSGGKIESAGKSKWRTYTSRIEFTGTYDQIGIFIRDLENKFPTGEIRMLSVTGSAEDKGQHRAAADLTLRVLPDEASKAAETDKKS